MPLRIIRILILFISLGLLAVSALAQGVRAVVVNDNANIRLVPAIGAEVLGTVAAGYTFEIVTARSADNEWIRVDWFGEEGWVNLAPLTILDSSIGTLPVADPRSIPYGGFASSRAGSTDQQGGVAARATDGLRVRAGPGRAYPTLANINFNQLMTLTGRTAGGRWFQVSFEGVLGWVSSQFVEVLSGDLTTLPIDGIVAKAPPLSGEGFDEYLATLRLMRDRLNIAQGSLNAIRTAWTDASLTGRTQCNPYPARPSDFHIATPLLAAHYDPLNLLQLDFNVAMTNLRLAIDLFIEICNLPGSGNPVGTATVQGALDVVNLTEAQFVSLRDRLNRLIPPDVIGPNQCLLVYNNKSEVLPVITVGTIYLDEFTRRNYSTGYCFDGVQGQILMAQALPLPDSNVSIFMSISPLDDPRSFLGIAQAGNEAYLALGPITLPRTTRYLVILADLSSDGILPDGQFAVRIADGSSTTVLLNLNFDEATGSVILTAEVPGAVESQPSAGGTTDPSATAVAPGTVCPSTAFNCNQLFTCEEARACLLAGNFSLDADNDNLPCEETLCAGQ